MAHGPHCPVFYFIIKLVLELIHTYLFNYHQELLSPYKGIVEQFQQRLHIYYLTIYIKVSNFVLKYLPSEHL